MNTVTSTKENYIQVIPHDLILNNGPSSRVRIEKLCYWYDGECEHPVNDQTIMLFLRHAKLYSVSIYPERPELGCYATDSQIQPEYGEIDVHEIYYKGNLIYRNC